MPKGRYSSLKTRSIVWITGLVFILSTLTLVNFGLTRRSLHQLSGMIDITIIANNLNGLAGSVTEGLPAEIEEYSLHPSPKGREKILAKLSKIESYLAQLEPMVADEEGKLQFLLTKNMFQSTHENFLKIERKITAKNSFSEINDLVGAVKDGSGLIKDAVERLISIELSEQQIAKVKLAREMDVQAFVLLMAIFFASIFGMVIFYVGLLKKRILGPLSEMQDKMEKIANDTGDIKLRVHVEYNDEIGKVADFFNKMADSIQKFKEHLEELVENRTSQLKDAHAMLVQAGKLSALGEMAGGVAHEINNPLSVIQLKSSQLVELVGEQELDRSQIEGSAKVIEHTVNRIAKIVKGLRSFSRNATNDPFVETPLSVIIEDTLSLCAEKLKMQSVAVRVPKETSLTLSCRATEISQVLLNLINNSFDALEGKKDPWIELQVHEAGPDVEIWVTDSGKGIPKAVQEKIFQPFFTTKEIGKGTGLGLSISKGIIEAHGGSFSIDNQCSNTRFVIRLPRRQDRKAA